MFNAHAYFENICKRMKLTSEKKYKFCRVTGIDHLEETIHNFTSEKAYFCIDDTEDGASIKKGGAWFEKRAYTIFLLKKFPFNKMDMQKAALDECRQIYRNILSKLIADRSRLENEMTYLDTERIAYHEIPGYFVSGCTGLYFNIIIEIPTNLVYDGNEWES